MVESKTDHDLLIELKATFDAFMKRYDSDMLQLKDGYTSKLNDHEVRLKSIEKVVDQTDLVESYKEFVVLKQEFHDWKTTANVIRVIAGMVGGIVFYLLTQIPNILRLAGITK